MSIFYLNSTTQFYRSIILHLFLMLFFTKNCSTRSVCKLSIFSYCGTDNLNGKFFEIRKEEPDYFEVFCIVMNVMSKLRKQSRFATNSVLWRINTLQKLDTHDTCVCIISSIFFQIKLGIVPFFLIKSCSEKVHDYDGEKDNKHHTNNDMMILLR